MATEHIDPALVDGVIDTSGYKKRFLDDEQLVHAVKMNRWLTKYGRAVDMSQTGQGKTYCAMWQYKTLPKIKYFLVLGSAKEKGSWDVIAKETGVTYDEFIPYTSLAGRATKNSGDVIYPKHGYLEKHKVKEPKGKTKASKGEKSKKIKWEYKPTKELKKLVKNGVLVCFDEVHNAKNKTSEQTEASRVLCWTIYTEIMKLNKKYRKEGLDKKCPSKIIFMSATFFDKNDHAYNMMRILGLTDEHLKYQKVGLNPITLKGLADIWDNCCDIDKDTTRETLLRITDGMTDDIKDVYSCETLKTLDIELMDAVIRPNYGFAMPPPRIESTTDCYNYYGFIKSERIKSNLRFYLEKLSSIGQRVSEGENLLQQGLKCVLQAKEYAKRKLYLRSVREQLVRDPKCKVIVGLWYKKTIAYLEKKLADYKPLIYTGDIKPDDRAEQTKLFQKNNNKRRLIICNVTCVDTGISLDDRHGGRQRYVFCESNYVIIKIVQFIGRFTRRRSKSRAIFRLMFAAGVGNEQNILDKLKTKKEVLKKNRHQQITTILPGEFPTVVEDEKDRLYDDREDSDGDILDDEEYDNASESEDDRDEFSDDENESGTDNEPSDLEDDSD